MLEDLGRGASKEEMKGALRYSGAPWLFPENDRVLCWHRHAAQVVDGLHLVHQQREVFKGQRLRAVALGQVGIGGGLGEDKPPGY